MRHLVIASDSGPGRLANQLWHYAKVAAWCHEHGLGLVHGGMLKFGREFGSACPLGSIEGKAGRMLGGMACNRRRKLLRLLARSTEVARLAACVQAVEVENTVDLAACPAPCRKFSVLRGWYFENIAGLVRHREFVVRVLAPAAEVRMRAQRCLERVDAEGMRVGVHIRAGDYRTWAGGRYFVEASEYAGAMRCIAAQMSPRKVSFLVASDEPLPAEVASVPGVIAGPGDAAGDLAMLSGCDLVLSTRSTFAMWAAYVADVPLVSLRSPPGEEEGFCLEGACDIVRAGRAGGHFSRAILRTAVRV